MRCETAELELSARLDGERDTRLDEAVEEHLAGCERCRAFVAGAGRIRHAARIEPAGPIPDLVPQIMDRVRGEARRLRVAFEWRRPAAAFAAAAVVAALIVGGLPGVRDAGREALATEIPRRVAEASSGVDAYQATFEIVERNFHQRVPVRRFSARVSFRSPERFQVQVADRTAYPPGLWPQNDLSLAVDRARWVLRGPASCPRESLPTCATGDREVRAVRGREPFDGDALVPTDIILPVRTLSGTERVAVVGESRLLGRQVVTVELAYRDATPLFAYLQAGGAWRPFFPLDRVRVSLDRETWFPLAYEVLPARSPERGQWALSNGLPPEPPSRPILQVRADSFRATAPDIPPIPRLPAAADEGFRDAAFPSVGRYAESGLLFPADLMGLRPYRAGVFTGNDRPRDEVLLSFAHGLDWLKIRQTRSWDEPALYGDVGSLAIPATIPGSGVAYYEPASAALGRRLSIHTGDVDLYVESNLPQRDLLRVAASIPVRGRAIPRSWLVRRWPGGFLREQVTVDRAREAVPGMLLPTTLPPGYRLWTTHLARAGEETGATVYFRRPGAELEGVGIRLHQAVGAGLPPPLDPDVVAVRVRGTAGRYAPGRGELEWVEDGVYRSLRAEGLDLSRLLLIAGSLAPASEAGA